MQDRLREIVGQLLDGGDMAYFVGYGGAAEPYRVVPCFVAEKAEAFADAVAQLLTDGERWRELSAGGRRFAERELSPAARDAEIAELYEELARD